MMDVVTGLEEELVVPHSFSTRVRGDHKRMKVIPDGNRGATVPDIRVQLWDREFFVGLKGTGARISMYDDGPLGLTGMPVSHDPIFTSESWFGENPWGAMSHQGCMEDKVVTELAGPDGIHGFSICPMVRATPFPDWLMEEARSRFWYRRLDRPGPYYQQVRLMPSNVRLFYQSELALGRKTPGVLEAFKISSLEDLDHFMDNYIRSGIAALTLIPRTIRRDEKLGRVALDFSDVWLDKDSVVASDGTIFFADIEGLDWVPIRDDYEAKLRMKRQFDRNFYEFVYGLDCLLRERDQMANRRTPRIALRLGLMARLELALENDNFVELKRTGKSLNISINPPEDQVEGVSVKMLDFD
jgi:hypothetical protein